MNFIQLIALSSAIEQMKKDNPKSAREMQQVQNVIFANAFSQIANKGGAK